MRVIGTLRSSSVAGLKVVSLSSTSEPEAMNINKARDRGRSQAERVPGSGEQLALERAVPGWSSEEDNLDAVDPTE